VNLQSRIGRALVARGLGPSWAKRAYRDEVNMALLLEFVLSDDSNCVDVGSHEGRVLAEFVRLAPKGKHIAYEPLPHLFASLRRKFPGVDVREAALSNANGWSAFTHVRNLPAYSGFRMRTCPGHPDIETIRVRTERLDDHLPPGYAPALIKVDVEGAEKLVIEGAMDTIVRYRPIVLFEHGKGGSDHYETSPQDIFNLLAGTARLRIFDLDGRGPYSLGDFERTYERNDYWNFVAHS